MPLTVQVNGTYRVPGSKDVCGQSSSRTTPPTALTYLMIWVKKKSSNDMIAQVPHVLVTQ